MGAEGSCWFAVMYFLRQLFTLREGLPFGYSSTRLRLPQNDIFFCHPERSGAKSRPFKGGVEGSGRFSVMCFSRPWLMLRGSSTRLRLTQNDQFVVELFNQINLAHILVV